MPTGSVSSKTLQMPSTTTVNTQGLFNTGIPGFEALSQIASSNVKDLLSGAPSLARNRNAGATFAASMGLAPAGGTGDFMDRWNYDLYGNQADARKQAGLSNLLNLIQGYSGTVVARPGEIIGSQTAQRGQDISRDIAGAELGQRAYEFGQTFPESQRQFDVRTELERSQLAQQGQQFNADFALRQLLGIGGLGQNVLNSYLNFLQ